MCWVKRHDFALVDGVVKVVVVVGVQKCAQSTRLHQIKEIHSAHIEVTHVVASRAKFLGMEAQVAASGQQIFFDAIKAKTQLTARPGLLSGNC